jgi:hypothetical protein
MKQIGRGVTEYAAASMRGHIERPECRTRSTRRKPWIDPVIVIPPTPGRVPDGHRRGHARPEILTAGATWLSSGSPAAGIVAPIRWTPALFTMVRGRLSRV